MKVRLGLFLIILINLFLTQFCFAQKQYVNMGASVIKVDGQYVLAVSFKNKKGWHTYWKNPGDAGLAISLDITSDNEQMNLKEFPWPTPKRYIEQGNMWAYGYSGSYALFYKLPSSLKNANIGISGKWLVCAEICIPGSKDLELKITDYTGEANPQMSTSQLITSFKMLPRSSQDNSIQFYLTQVEQNKLVLHYIIEDVNLAHIRKDKNLITPYEQAPFSFMHEKLFIDKKKNILYGEMLIDWDGAYEDPEVILPKDGRFLTPYRLQFLLNYSEDGISKIITHEFENFSLIGSKTPLDLISDLEEWLPGNQEKIANKPTKSIWLYILFGFLGGVILNLMPCILPVITLKLFGFIVHSDEPKSAILKHNLAYTFGVLASFMFLAVTVIFLQKSGQNIGWGFQLQSPSFVFIMLLFIFILALNLMGMFEFITPGGKTIGNMEMKKSLAGDVMNGVLATILSTPCSAPFLGTALGFAFTTSAMSIIIIFLSIGIGLSFPFILTAFFPALVKLLPKPGAWMEKLKKFLGLSLLLTVVWLYDVFSSLTDMSISGIYINTALAAIFFVFYLRKNITKNKLVTFLFTLLPIFLLIQVQQLGGFKVARTGSGANQAQSQWKSWTKEKMVAADQIVFVNFTASWCLTCKVNKKVFLDTPEFKKFVKENNILLLEGDWTKRDKHISDFLSSYSIVGVPAYFLKDHTGRIISLGETISLTKLKKHLGQN